MKNVFAAAGMLVIALIFSSALTALADTTDLLLIPGGEFLMGSPEEEPWRSDDETQHRVTVSSFYMSAYEAGVSFMNARLLPDAYNSRRIIHSSGSYSKSLWVKKGSI